ncbi:MAG: hypothetical protein H6741_08205 [Alphaproteobacteria bacterium]|nr:hypothetical protein [Alphaproteobacteria bacterium]
MIVVTGTKRAGTSLWMQVLRAAGLPVIGEAFPPPIAALREANPRGFYESRLISGVYYRTNPDPETGLYLHPEATRRHAVKVFIPGLVRSDLSFLDHVIATLRPWREYVGSMLRMRDIQRASRPEGPEGSSPEALAMDWWAQVYALIRDASTRRYPLTLVSYERLLRDPEREVAEVLAEIGEGALSPAVQAVRPELRRALPAAPALDPETVAVFDAVYAAVDARRALEPALLESMNALQRRLKETPA